MNPEELAQQIHAFKSRRLKTRWAYYGSFISLFLIISSLTRGLTLSALITFLLILPLPLYFLLQTYRLTRKNLLLKSRSAQLIAHLDNLPTRFSFRQFLTQPAISFRLTLILFLLVTFTTFARTHTTSPTLTMNHTPLTIDQ